MRLFAIFAFLSILLTLTTKSYSNTPFIDSLEFEMKDLEGEKKLERMFQIANIYITTNHLYEIGNWIELEATKQNNLRYIAGSKNIKARYYLQGGHDIDSVIYYAKQANAMYDDNNIQNTNQGHLYIIDAYLEKGYYALAISSLKDFLEANKNDIISDSKANMILSNIFLRLGDYVTGLEYLEEEVKDLQTLDPTNNHLRVIENYLATAQSHLLMEKYDESFRYINMAESILQNNSKIISKSNFQQYLFRIYLLRIDLYFEKKDLAMLQIALSNLKQTSTTLDLTPIQRIELKSTEAQYYLLIGDYKKALPLLDESINFMKVHYPAQFYFIKKTIELKIENLKSLGQLDDALDTQADLLQYNDSVYRQNLSTLPYQIAELSETHKLTKVKLEHEKSQAILERSKVINISLIIAFVLLSVTLFVVKQNLKKTKEKNKFLVKQYNELDKQRNLFKEKQPINNKEKQRKSTLFEKIEIYIESHEAFRDPNLNRESIAKVLNTNEIYVAKAIKYITGKTFVEYVNQYRLEYSRQRLLTNTSEPVKVILQDAGFSSDTSFYRLFKEAYGMSSSEIRQAKKELEKDKSTKY